MRTAIVSDMEKKNDTQSTTPAVTETKKNLLKLLYVIVLFIAIAGAAVVIWKQNNQSIEVEYKQPEQSDVIGVSRSEADAAYARMRTASEKNTQERKEVYYIQECRRYYFELPAAISAIRKANYSRGQTFGKQLDVMIDGFNRGIAEWKKDNAAVAYKHFKSAAYAVEWININAPLRVKYLEFKKEADAAMKEASRFECAKFAGELYERAQTAGQNAVKAFEAGDILFAHDQMLSSARAYQSAAKKACADMIEELKQSAAMFTAEKKWDKLEECIRKIQSLDKTVDISSLLRSHAENVLKVVPAGQSVNAPVLSINVTADGKTVPATFAFGINKLTPAGNYIGGFLPGVRYKTVVTYQNGAKQYAGIVEFYCDWTGKKELTAALNPVETFQVNLPQGKTVTLIKVKAGTFMMGSPAEEFGRYNFEKLHEVTISKDYYLGQYEITQEQYAALMGDNPSDFKNANHPVENVSWNDAREFCHKLNILYKGKLPAGYKFDLPTEAQWEYACRAGTVTALYNNRSLSDLKYKCDYLNEIAWYNYNAKAVSHQPVGGKIPNAWMFYDMLGNVQELCSDWFFDTYDVNVKVDPTGPKSGYVYVVRGGAWSDRAAVCRSANRDSAGSTAKRVTLGFRLALVPVQ